jgi:hypothetical protein
MIIIEDVAQLGTCHYKTINISYRKSNLISTNCNHLPVHALKQPSFEEWHIVICPSSIKDAFCVMNPLPWVFIAKCLTIGNTQDFSC